MATTWNGLLEEAEQAKKLKAGSAPKGSEEDWRVLSITPYADHKSYYVVLSELKGFSTATEYVSFPPEVRRTRVSIVHADDLTNL